jgi:hypothetical protein
VIVDVAARCIFKEKIYHSFVQANILVAVPDVAIAQGGKGKYIMPMNIFIINGWTNRFCFV